MGSRSDVALLLRNTVQIPQNIFEILSGYSDEISYQDGDKLFVIHCIKWYDDTVNDWINTLDDDDYRFIRLGEDDDDIEQLGEFYDGPMEIGLSRSIHIANDESEQYDPDDIDEYIAETKREMNIEDASSFFLSVKKASEEFNKQVEKRQEAIHNQVMQNIQGQPQNEEPQVDS